MANPPKKKVFYQIDEVCERLGLSLLDMSVLVSERKIQLCTAVAGLLVEDGNHEVEAKVKSEVASLCARFPLYAGM